MFAKKYVLFFLLLSFSFLFVLVFFIYTKINTYDSNRLYSVRKVPKIYRASLIADFIDNKYKKDSILIIGDSQAYGFEYPNEYIFSSILSKKINNNIINLAFIDSRILDNTYILEYLKNKNMRFKTIIYSVNPTHIKNSDFSRVDISHAKSYEYGIFFNLKPFLTLAQYPNPDKLPIFGPEMKIPKDYFDVNATSLNSYTNKLVKLITISKSISDNVIIYVTPYKESALINDDQHNFLVLNQMLNHVHTVCNHLQITYIQPPIKNDEDFFDIVHFNANGHKKMADTLYKYMEH